MDDFSMTFAPYPPAKRKRLDFENGPHHTQTPSKIEDKRVTASQTLRLDCDFITIIVGQDEHKQSFKVHEDAICDRSEFFRNSMKEEWASMRPDPRVIELPEEDAEAFALYRTWIYTGQLAILPEPPYPSAPAPALEEVDQHYHTLAYAYVLGEHLLDKQFKNAIADVYVLYARGMPPSSRYYPSHEEIRILYDGTGPNSPIRQLLVDIWYCRGKHEWIDENADLPKEFLTRVVKELLRVKPNNKGADALSRPWKLEHQQYHEK